MHRDKIHKKRNKSKLPQTPKQAKHDGVDVEFSKELADHDDMEALRRSEEADRRAHKRD